MRRPTMFIKVFWDTSNDWMSVWRRLLWLHWKIAWSCGELKPPQNLGFNLPGWLGGGEREVSCREMVNRDSRFHQNHILGGPWMCFESHHQSFQAPKMKAYPLSTYTQAICIRPAPPHPRQPLGTWNILLELSLILILTISTHPFQKVPVTLTWGELPRLSLGSHVELELWRWRKPQESFREMATICVKFGLHPLIMVMHETKIGLVFENQTSILEKLWEYAAGPSPIQ